MASKLETAAKIYLAASRMNVDLTMVTMRLMFQKDSWSEILDAVKIAMVQMSQIATTPEQLSRSAMLQLVRHDGSADTARINMTRRHPCNTTEQIEEAILSIYSHSDDYNLEHKNQFLADREFYHNRVFVRNISNTEPAWSEIFARICDVDEETETPPIYPEGIYDHWFMGSQDEYKERMVKAAKNYLVRNGEDDRIHNTLKAAYLNMPDYAGEAIAKAKQQLCTEAAEVNMSEMKNFAWIQMVCGLFGRKNVRNWITQEYPYADETRINEVMKKAAEQLTNDINAAGLMVIAPGVMHQFVAANNNELDAKKAAREQWDYLDKMLIRDIFDEFKRGCYT